MQYSFLGFSVLKMMELNLDMKDMAILRYFVDFKDTGRMHTEVIEGEKYYWINYRTMEGEMPYLGLGKRAIMLRMLKLRDLGILIHHTKKEGGTFSFFALGSRYDELINNKDNKSKESIDEGNKLREKVEGKRQGIMRNSNRKLCKQDVDSNKANIKEELEEVNSDNHKEFKINTKEEIAKQEITKQNVFMDNQENSEMDGSTNMNNVQSYTQGVHKNDNELCTKMVKGCAQKGRTNTHLLNNSSTKETLNIKNIKKEICDIIDYLNSKLGTQYNSNSKNTFRIIMTKIIEGYSFNDFKEVIDKKVKAWLGTEFEQYLTPSTLFGAKFEKYLNQKILNSDTLPKNNYDAPKLRFNNFKAREYDYEILERQLLGWE